MPFIFSLIIIVFVLFTQFLLRAIDRFIGKGLDIGTIFEYLFLNLGWISALAVPMAVLVAALMAFGQFSEDNEITAMREGWLTASVLRPIDDSGVGVADAFFAHSKGEKVPQSWSGPFKMIDKWSDADEIVNYSNRYSKPKMGR